MPFQSLGFPQGLGAMNGIARDMLHTKTTLELGILYLLKPKEVNQCLFVRFVGLNNINLGWVH